MREINFRGKRVDNGEWVYGNLAHINDEYMISVGYRHHNELNNPHLEWIDVSQETIEQYTGTQDLSSIQCQQCKEKDKRIAELETELESKKSALRFAKASYDLLADENARLNKLLKERCKMIAYIIKRDDGLYLNEIYQKYNAHWTEFLLSAYLFEDGVDAYEILEQFRVFHNVNCKIVKVEIKEVEK